jgi:tRNA(fMet)-specific endonuclease VapC
VILDTNALSAWAEADGALLRVLPVPHRLVLPIVVIGEYKQGLLRSRYRDRLESWLDATIRTVRLGSITLATTDMYAQVLVRTRERGRPIPTNDAWVAAIALEHHLPVLSRDAHFDVVDGVQRVSW